MTASPEEMTIAHLDFEPELPCEGTNECAQPATWRLTVHVPCGHPPAVSVICAVHRNIVLRVFEQGAICMQCSCPVILRSIIAIRKSS